MGTGQAEVSTQPGVGGGTGGPHRPPAATAHPRGHDVRAACLCVDALHTQQGVPGGEEWGAEEGEGGGVERRGSQG